MTWLWLTLSKLFKASFGFYDTFGYILNWILFFAASALFSYWCWVLVKKLGNNKDKEYYSPTEGKFQYYDPTINKRKNS